MAMKAAPSHIVLGDEGRAWIEGTATKVIEVATDRYAHGWSAEEMHFQHPHLTLVQIHAALSYYYEHRVEMDAKIEAGAHVANELRANAAPSAFPQRMRHEGKLEHDPRFLARIEQARQSIKGGRGVMLEDMES